MTKYKQKGIRVTTYMTVREKKMLEAICEKTQENMSQVVTALIMQEYYRLLEIGKKVNDRMKEVK